LAKIKTWFPLPGVRRPRAPVETGRPFPHAGFVESRGDASGLGWRAERPNGVLENDRSCAGFSDAAIRRASPATPCLASEKPAQISTFARFRFAPLTRRF
jgi:hypothetical protein